MPESVVITLTENNEETDTADEFEDGMSFKQLHVLFRNVIIMKNERLNNEIKLMKV